MRLLRRCPNGSGASVPARRFADVSGDPPSPWDAPSYQLLQQSPVPTLLFQRSLPRLPVPELSRTCDRYLASQRPLLDPEAYRETAKKVAAFVGGGEGRRLDRLLKEADRRNRHTSYISRPWTDLYLEDRRSVVFHHNPGIAFAEDAGTGADDPAVAPARLALSALRFFRSLRTGRLLPDVYRADPGAADAPRFWRRRAALFPEALAAPLARLHGVHPLDMSQFRHLFQSTRVPGRERDTLERFPDARHLVVLRRGHFYKVDALDGDFRLFPPSHYVAAFRRVLDAGEEARGPGVGVLASEDRPAWFEARRRLLSHPGNASSLRAVDAALFAVCLDDWACDPSTPGATVGHLVCGPDPTNRWCDKSFSLVFSKNGRAGIHFEHAWGDGVAVMRLVDDVAEDARRNDFLDGETGRGYDGALGSVEKLEFVVDEELREAIECAKKKYFSRLNKVTFDVLQREGFGRDACRAAGVGPDAATQLAFQIAYHKLEGKCVPTYESCSTAVFRHGRTETLRPGTVQTKSCAEAFNVQGKVQKSSAELLALMRDCSSAHNALAKLASQGQGWDRHLFALKRMAISEGGVLPEIFTDRAYLDINENVLSTSTLSSPNMSLGGFCPVTRKGFGLGYQIQTDRIGIITSSFVRESSGSQLNEALSVTFDQFQKVFNSIRH